MRIFTIFAQNLERSIEFMRFMRRYLIAISALLTLLSSCGGNKTNNTDDVADSLEVRDTVAADSLTAEISETPMPKAADELFDDFIFNFAANKRLQMERIKFPLPYINGDKKEMLTKDKWKMDYFFMRQGYYTLIFDNERHMESVKDTGISHAVVEKIYFNTHSIIQYVFDRPRGAWMLMSINTIPIAQSANASFLQFYHHFVTDPQFQQESLGSTVHFVGPDPDDDFSMMEGIITPDTWEAFAPELPSKMIYNIIYGETKKETNSKLFVLRGIANGQELEMTFKRKDGKWLLTKLAT